MADVSDPKIDQAYQDVRSSKTETNWLLLDYISDRSDKLSVTQTGTGGLEELREVLDDTKASYAYVRVTYSNDKESTREKFILVVNYPCMDRKVLQGDEESKGVSSVLFPSLGMHMDSYCDPRSQISVHSADVKQVLRVYSMEVAPHDKDDLKEDPIVVKLRKAGGASYDGV
ncbi:hypothetical protein H0H93_003098 [Arthromyces matolae]|nr:hypothetical protein H0H93_003098 [Arthromyces matolae]